MRLKPAHHQGSRTRSLAILTAVLLSTALGVRPAARAVEPFAGLAGSGTEADPFRITSASDLTAFSAAVNSSVPQATQWHFKLTKNLNFTGLSWTPAGREGHEFQGSFDGGGHTVKGLSDPLFGVIRQSASFPVTVMNLRLEGSVVSSEMDTGSLANLITGERIPGARVSIHHIIVEEATVTSDVGYAGGLVGNMRDGSLSLAFIRVRADVHSKSVYADAIAGGVIGCVGRLGTTNPNLQDFTAEACDFSGEVTTGRGGRAAGIVGWLPTGTIRYCRSDSSSSSFRGGLTGGIATISIYVDDTYSLQRPSVTIEYCYSTAAIDCNTNLDDYSKTCAGGIVATLFNPMPNYFVRGNVALNPYVNGGSAGRVGNSINSAATVNNLADSAMTLNGAAVSDSTNNGTGVYRPVLLDVSDAWPAGFLGADSPFTRIPRDLPALLWTLAPDDDDEDPAIILTAPESVPAEEGTPVSVSVSVTGWPGGDHVLLDGIIAVPSFFTVESVTAAPALTGGDLVWNLDEATGRLRFVFTNTRLDAIGLNAGSFPAQILVISLKTKPGIDPSATPYAVIGTDSATLKTTVSDPEFLFTVDSRASVRIALSSAPVVIGARELYTGDGTDLIPADARVHAVTFAGAVKAGQTITYKGSTRLFYSSEFSARNGVETYLLFTSPAENASAITDAANYEFSDEPATTVAFGDTDGNGIINAQDAMDTISAWLRRIPIDTDLKIAVFNVTGDSVIDTMDAISIMEFYISGLEFPVLGK